MTLALYGNGFPENRPKLYKAAVPARVKVWYDFLNKIWCSDYIRPKARLVRNKGNKKERGIFKIKNNLLYEGSSIS